MSLGSIPRHKQLSDAQFIGDLMGLFKRHRIESAAAGGLTQFETYLGSKDNFRSQLFTLCTAISHMADEDLSGEELLGLIGRALGVREGEGAEIPEGMRSAFLSGYDAWSNRAMTDSDIWPPERMPTSAHEPIPFPQPTEALPEPEHGLRVPGLPTVQEALLMAKKQAPFELPARVVQVPAAHANPGSSQQSGDRGPTAARQNTSPPGTDVENLTISELTRLLEEIEQRMSRIRPQVHELTSLIHPPSERPERLARLQAATSADASEASEAAPKVGPALVVPAIEAPQTELDAALLITEDVENDPFVARHAYLNPKRRRRVPSTPPAPLLAVPISVPPPPLVAESELAPAPAPEVVPAPPKVRIIPRPANAMAPQYQHMEAAIREESDSYRILIHIAIGVLAAVILVSIPLAGVMVYRSSHPRYEYPDVQPASQSNADTTVVSPDGTTVRPASAGNSTEPSGQPAAATPAKVGTGSRRGVKRKPPPPVAVWPPPPAK